MAGFAGRGFMDTKKKKKTTGLTATSTGAPPHATGGGADPGDDDAHDDPTSQYHDTLGDLHHQIHKHLRAAHAASGSAIARQHINQAGMVAKQLHQTATGGPEGMPMDQDTSNANGGGYAGNS